MEFKGTPAPWEITAEHLDTRLQINHGHIDLWFGDAVADQVTRDQAEANANLIASAPELYEALKAVYERCLPYEDCDIALFEQAKQALAKATGKK